MELIEALLSTEAWSRQGLATRLGVSEATVARWIRGESRPRPLLEGKIRELSRLQHQLVVRERAPSLFDSEEQRDESKVRHALDTTFSRLRDCLHRTSRISSRQEALDEFTKLLFAHTLSVEAGGPGIARTMLDKNLSPAKSLKEFVDSAFASTLPRSIFLKFDQSKLSLDLKDSENQLAVELIQCFEPMSNPSFKGQLGGLQSVDILNEAFGKFLAASFVDEKELGQYLTPPEAVKFMTRLGLSSLPSDVITRLCDPKNCKSDGIILDPSCGVGSFLTETIRVLYPKVVDQHGKKAATTWTDSMTRNVLIGVDKSERMSRLALANLALTGATCANIHCANALDRNRSDAKAMRELECRALLILTNPPFGAEYLAQDLSHYRLASEWSKRPQVTIDSELLFLERYVDWLAPGGNLVAIVPDSVLTNGGIYEELRRGLCQEVRLRSVISLPSVTFSAAGTQTKTSILHFEKARSAGKYEVFFAVCEDIGYSVATRSSQKRKITNGRNDLIMILPEALRERRPQIGQSHAISPCSDRWDATYHSSLPVSVSERLATRENEHVRVRDIARLVIERTDPRREGTSGLFEYIEISDIDYRANNVRSKQIPCADAPSRARKKVRAGDVLVSTVRPERGIIGVVPAELDGAVCSTGLAVLRTDSINPLFLSMLMQSTFAREQIMRNNSGIAYPAVSEECLLDVVLPVSKREMQDLSSRALDIQRATTVVRQKHTKLVREIDAVINDWMLSNE